MAQRITEINVTDKQTADKVDELGSLAEQIAVLKNELSKAQKKAKDLESDLRPILEEMDEASDRILTTSKTAVRIVTKGYDRRSSSYKDAFDLALTKVNAATKKILNEALEASTSITTVASKLAASPIEEGVMDKVKQILSKFSKWVAAKVKKLKGYIKEMNVGANAIEKLSKMK